MGILAIMSAIMSAISVVFFGTALLAGALLTFVFLGAVINRVCRITIARFSAPKTPQETLQELIQKFPRSWEAAGARIARAEQSIPLGNLSAWNSFWEKELKRQEREMIAELRQARSRGR